MNRKDIVNEVGEYFCSDHWRRLWALLQQPDPQGIHIHHYVDTCIHPESLQRIICAYFEMKGHPSSRIIDWPIPPPTSGNLHGPIPTYGALHGIEPKGLVHFDFNYTPTPGVALAPSPPEHGQDGSNLLSWNRAYMEEYFKDFTFREVGPAEERALEAYFESEHWLRGLEIACLPTTAHVQIKIYTSVHPDVLSRFAERALCVKGWDVYYITAEVFLVQGKYTGKLTFLGKNPERTWDLCWRLDPETVVRPAGDTTWRRGTPFHGVDYLRDALEFAEKSNLVKLEDAEIKQIIEHMTPRV